MKLLKISLLFLLTGFFTSTNAADFEEVNAIDGNTIEMIETGDVIFSDTLVEWEVKILKDINISYSSKDAYDEKKVNLNLSSDLTPNTIYSLISIIGLDGNIDFETGDIIQGEIVNENLALEETWIEKINILDNRTIEVYYNYDVDFGSYEFKLLSELNTTDLYSNGDNKLYIGMENSLENSSKYMVMFVTLMDASGDSVDLHETLYDFITWSDLVEEEVNQEDELAEEEIVEEELVELNSADDYIDPILLEEETEVEKTEFEEAEVMEDDIQEVAEENMIEGVDSMIYESTPIVEEVKSENEENNIEEIALSVTKTPDTGAGTWLLFLLTFLVSGTLFVTKMYKKA